MSSNGERKRAYWSKESMVAAVDLVKNGLLSVRKAAVIYNLPRSTLADRVSGRINVDCIYGKRPQLMHEDERSLIDLAAQRAQQGVGFSKANFLRHAGGMAMEKGTPFKKTTPTDKWWRSLKTRHADFTLRTPESTASVRHESMTKSRTETYFSAVREELMKLGLLNCGERIWNMDETNMSLSTEPEKIVARKGARYLHSKSGSRENITLVVCGNAAGVYLDPHLIFKGKTKAALKSRDTNNAPVGTRLSVSPSGWMKQGLSLLWFQEVFLPGIGPDRPQILIFDGHDSHHHVELVHEARQNDITLIELPSHCSNWLQPLDMTVFGSLKSGWKSIVHDFTSSTSCTVTHSNFFRLFSLAWTRLTKDGKLLSSGFKATGICPLNPGAIPEEAYLTSFGKSSISGEQTTNDEAREELDLPLDLDVSLGPLRDEEIQDEEVQNDGDILVQDLGIYLRSDGTLVLNSPPMDIVDDSDYFGEPLDIYHEMMEEEPVFQTPDPVQYVPRKTKKQGFFVITSDAAFTEKVKAAKAKEEKEQKKIERQKKREQKISSLKMKS